MTCTMILHARALFYASHMFSVFSLDERKGGYRWLLMIGQSEEITMELCPNAI
jgi:hypothetical protein